MGKQKIELSIEGMTCNKCAQTVANKLEDKKGVLDKSVRYHKGQAEITYNPQNISKNEIIDTINAAGHYKVTGETGTSDKNLNRLSLVIIGGGSAAFSAAIRVSELGGNALIINKGLPTGGTCVNTGCVPSKTLIRAAETHHRAGHSNFKGIETKSRISNFKKIIDQKQQLVEDLRRQKYADVIKNDPNIQLITAHGTILDEHSVEADGKIWLTDNILIATGASAFIPDIPGLEEVGYLTNKSAYELERLPENLVILGGGYIALENAQLFSRLGSKVTIIQRSDQILSDQHADLASALTHYLQEEEINIMTNTQIQKVERNKKTGKKIIYLSINDEVRQMETDDILVATGRKGNTTRLGLENIGIKTENRAYIPVDETLRTGNPAIFAAGDVTGTHQFVYTASYEGKIAAQNALQNRNEKTDYSALPWVIFTDPQVAGVGMDERKARKAGLEVDTATLSLEHIPRSLAARDTRGFIKLIRNRQDDQLMGARILAPEGSELLMELTLAIRHKITVESIKSAFHPYLTLSEGIKLTALTFDKDVNKLSCCAT